VADKPSEQAASVSDVGNFSASFLCLHRWPLVYESIYINSSRAHIVCNNVWTDPDSVRWLILYKKVLMFDLDERPLVTCVYLERLV
jgi:hypothetical protein